MNNFQKLQKIINYKFNHEVNLETALTHPSLKQTKYYKFDYQRLEFLGDSVLNIVITKYLYSTYPDLKEGQLAQFRNNLISKNIIYKAACKINIDEYIIMTEGEEKSGGRTNINNIEDTFEALIGAIFVDSQYSIIEAENFILNLWKGFFKSYNHDDDAKTFIQNYSQSKGFGTPNYRLMKQEGPIHSPTFYISLVLNNEFRSTGLGKSIKAAQKEAAENMKKLIT